LTQYGIDEIIKLLYKRNKGEIMSEEKLEYRCEICGYIYEGDISQESDDYVCPICGQPKSVFVKVEE
jgi:rubrerythrin